MASRSNSALPSKREFNRHFRFILSIQRKFFCCGALIYLAFVEESPGQPGTLAELTCFALFAIPRAEPAAERNQSVVHDQPG